MVSLGPFSPWPPADRRMLDPLAVSARGMSTQQRFLEVISANIANAETTHAPGGGPYQRQVAVAAADGVRVEHDPSPGRMQYDPGHPDADADGFVRYPNVDLNTELVDLMIARRAFEANATAFQAAKTILGKSLEI
ncbi:MAG TPA: flagellar basal body rod protein FlgC [Dongiaceae bacterium]|nr:flagellar basal body rod protein FlgC [Dongiaceae bacterium]